MGTSVHGNSSEATKELGFFDRFFLSVERLAYTYSITVILVALLTASLSIWVTVEKLSFKNNRGDLVTKNLDYVESYEKYRQEFEDFDGMMVVVTDEDPGKMKEFVDFFVTKLKSYSESFSTVFYRIDTEYFR